MTSNVGPLWRVCDVVVMIQQVCMVIVLMRVLETVELGYDTDSRLNLGQMSDVDGVDGHLLLQRCWCSGVARGRLWLKAAGSGAAFPAWLGIQARSRTRAVSCRSPYAHCTRSRLLNARWSELRQVPPQLL